MSDTVCLCSWAQLMEMTELLVKRFWLPDGWYRYEFYQNWYPWRDFGVN